MKDPHPYDLALRLTSLRNLIAETDSPRERQAATAKLEELQKAHMHAINRVARIIDRGQVPEGDRWERGERMAWEEVRL